MAVRNDFFLYPKLSQSVKSLKERDTTSGAEGNMKDQKIKSDLEIKCAKAWASAQEAIFVSNPKTTVTLMNVSVENLFPQYDPQTKELFCTAQMYIPFGRYGPFLSNPAALLTLVEILDSTPGIEYAVLENGNNNFVIKFQLQHTRDEKGFFQDVSFNAKPHLDYGSELRK